MESARIVKQMREMGMSQLVLGSDRMTHPDFLEIGGDAADGVVAACPWDPTRQDPMLDAFRQTYGERFGVPPETYAAHAYDGMNMLVEAIEEAGLNRAKLRDALEARRRDVFEGVTGPIPLNDVYTNAGPIAIAEVRDGIWHYMSEEAAGVQLPRIVKR